jgi:GDP-L-fucose synthase
MSYKNHRVYIAGHKGMVGSALLHELEENGFNNLIVQTRLELDLTDKVQVSNFFRKSKPQIVILCAAKVGGIQANINEPATFLYENLQIQNNVMKSSSDNNIEKFIFMGSSCVYPKHSPQPIKEEYLLAGHLEPTNEGYAIAKIAGIKLLENLGKQNGLSGISLMPCNLYGPNDSFDPINSHVLSALIRKFVDAVDKDEKMVTLWGTGQARREFLHVSDLARAVLLILNQEIRNSVVNVGSGVDISISDLAKLIAKKTEYQGDINWDHSRPDGMLRKCLDTSKISDLGFVQKISLSDGVEEMIQLYKKIKVL